MKVKMASNRLCEHELSSMKSATKALVDAAAVENSNRIFPRKFKISPELKGKNILENEAMVGSTSDMLSLK